MAMHQGFDLSRFKKVSSDAKTTTMRHANGHEVKIVHSALSPAMRAQIDGLQTHQEPVKMAKGGAVKKMADGGDTGESFPKEGDFSGSMSPEDEAADLKDFGNRMQSKLFPKEADDLPSGADLSAVNATNRPAGMPPPPDAAPSPDQAPAAPTDQAATTPAPSSDEKDIPVINVTGQKPPAPTMQSLTAEQQAWQNDLTNGHIAPETYQGLYAKKDTLGKIGTIFGLLVGGAPSNNMAFQMMDKQIHNDMQAQIQSKSNAVNYYNAATNMAQGMANADQIAAHTGLINARLGVYQSLLDNTAKMTPGPGQQKAQMLLQQMFPAMQAQNAQDNAKAVLAAHHGSGSGFNGPVNGDAITALGIAAPEIGGPAKQEGDRVFQTRTLFNNYTHAYYRLNNITAGQGSEGLKQATDAVAGLIPFSTLPASVASLAKDLQQEREAEKAAMPGVPDQFLPSGYDFLPGEGGAETRAEKANRGAAWFKLQEGQNPTLGALQKRGYNVMTPQPYDDWSSSMRETKQPKSVHVNVDSSGLHIHQNAPGAGK